MISIRRILCPVDFSDCAERALDHAVALAKWYHARLAVLHVYRLPVPVAMATPGIVPSELLPIPLTPAERAQLVASLENLVSSHRVAGPHIDILLDEDLEVAGSIVRRAASLPADLVVIGTHGRSGFERFMLGSVAEKVLRGAACPVLTVPPHCDPEAVHRPSLFPQILCPLDFSKASARALEYASSLANDAGAQVTLLHVVDLPEAMPEPGAPDLSGYRVARFKAAEHALESAADAMRNGHHVTQRILTGKPYREILRVAGELEPDLIVMGVQGRSAIDLGFFGSTTQHVVRRAPCPVLTLKAL
jgi:nucleotide-binding universal stress UspA family protein